MSTKRAYTLVELIITLTVFAVVAVLCVNALARSLASARKIQAQVFLYTEAQALMDQLANEVSRNAIDYEAYYLRYGYHSPESEWATTLYGYYAQTFYHPGRGDPSTLSGPYTNIDGYSVDCTSTTGYYPEDCPTETPIYDYLDLNTGAHPFTYINDYSGYTDDETYMNAFCESDDGSTDCTSLAYPTKEELILINSAGDHRTIFVHEAFGDGTEYRVSKVEMTGTDTDTDGVVDSWECTSSFDCTSSTVTDTPDSSDLTTVEDPETDFMPITPKQINVEDFYVILTPMEDPYRAFAEEAVQVQPFVTIFLTVTLSEDYAGNLLGELPSITLQRSISTGVYNTITSYE
jgi:prepilin-type N-terminal cleavage/methylation domain-containing protein